MTVARDEREMLAEERTDLAQDRTLLANERTYAGWLRTGMAAVGIGLGFNALFRALEPDWVPKAIATAFLGIGVLIFLVSERRACAVISRFKPHEVETFRLVNVRLITWAAVIATVALAAAMWALA